MADPGADLEIELRDGTLVLRADDGKANALSPALVAALEAGLDRAEKEAAAVAWLGRHARFSGGFDLAVLRGAPEARRGLVRAGAELFLRIYEFPKPVVIGCTGHAVGAGAIALLSADRRIGARGPFRIGLNEVSIGMTLPIFAYTLARERLSKRHFERAATQAELYEPDAAVDAGFLDAAVEPDALEDLVLAEAGRLAALPQPAFAATKRRLHAEVVAHVRETLDRDLDALTGG